MLADALDGALSAADQATFDLHMAACASCAGMLRDAERGMAWMEMLKSTPPEPSANLLDRIFAATTGNATAEALAAKTDSREHRRQPSTLLGHPIPEPSRASEFQPAAAFSGNVIPFRDRFVRGLRSFGQTMLQPRLAMTAAMAFFSIALTMNLTGVRLSGLRASDFKPSSILRNCYSAKARVVRYGDNLRVVYELESRVRDLQRSDEDFTNTPGPQNTPTTAKPDQSPSGTQARPSGQTPGQQNESPKENEDKQSRPKPGPGSSRRETPGGSLLFVGSRHRRGTESASLKNFAVIFPRVEDEGGLV